MPDCIHAWFRDHAPSLHLADMHRFLTKDRKPVPGYQVEPRFYEESAKTRCTVRYKAMAGLAAVPSLKKGDTSGSHRTDRVSGIWWTLPDPVLLDPNTLSQPPHVLDFLDAAMVTILRCAPLVRGGWMSVFGCNAAH